MPDNEVLDVQERLNVPDNFRPVIEACLETWDPDDITHEHLEAMQEVMGL